MRISRPAFNAIEVILFCVLAGVVGYVIGAVRAQSRLQPYLTRTTLEVEGLAERFGPNRNSERFEEWIVRDYFGDARDRVFVDVGANHHQHYSNTYFLETELGWSGLAIEPQPQFADGYAKHRPRTQFIPLFVSDVSNSRATLYVPSNSSLIASSTEEFVTDWGGQDVVPLDTNTTTLDDILARSRIEEIDFLSMDIELHEPAALKGFSIERYKPRLVCIEGHPQVRQEILDYFNAHGYVLIGKYLRTDSENLWFRPVE